MTTSTTTPATTAKPADCPPWCKDPHGAQLPPESAHLAKYHTTHLTILGGERGGAYVTLCEVPGETAHAEVHFSAEGNHAVIDDLTPESAVTLAELLDHVALYRNPAQLAHTLREAAGALRAAE